MLREFSQQRQDDLQAAQQGAAEPKPLDGQQPVEEMWVKREI